LVFLQSPQEKWQGILERLVDSSFSLSVEEQTPAGYFILPLKAKESSAAKPDGIR
jgi:hypothetical protein